MYTERISLIVNGLQFQYIHRTSLWNVEEFFGKFFLNKKIYIRMNFYVNNND